MKFISYTNDGRVVVQHAALILSKLDETDTLELHTMDNAIILLKKDMTLVETRDVLQGMVRLARSMTLDALCNSDAEDKTPLVDESVDDEYEDTITIPVPLEAFGDAGLLGKDLHIQVIDGAVVNGSWKLVGWFAGIVRWVQSGYIFHYALVMILGVFGLMTYFVWLNK